MIVYGAWRRTSPKSCVPSARKTCVESVVLCRKNIHIFHTLNTSGMFQIMSCWEALVYPEPLPGSPNFSTKKIPVRGTIKPLKIKLYEFFSVFINSWEPPILLRLFN